MISRLGQAYTSFLHPITSHKLWNDVKVWRCRLAGAGSSREGYSLSTQCGLSATPFWPVAPAPSSLLLQAHDDLEHFETPFVVKLFRFHPLAPCQVIADPESQGTFLLGSVAECASALGSADVATTRAHWAVSLNCNLSLIPPKFPNPTSKNRKCSRLSTPTENRSSTTHAASR